MSTYYLALTPVPMADLVGDRLKKHGIREKVVKGETNRKRKCLTDGTNFVWAYTNKKGLVTDFTRYGGNCPHEIFDAICEEFGVRIVSEHEPEFFGYGTYEEWDAAWAEEAKLSEEKFYNDVMNYVRGKPHSLGRGTIGMAQAQIAKKLIKKSPELAADANRAELMKAVKAIYDRDHTVTIDVTEKDIAAALEIPGTADPWDFAG
jgi:hypothetical protein